ncbi:uncharacterized protein BO88DRAFT_483685 [Aspergillus vadensis CBS 113365]|uniref:Uncharacterized protein n=1 Tax=Aspergillus vadensis (strain CBS 113365 / IMI 142717 / IBT 24658) TaxID=1448311 RepID=A0A319BTQ5_ASPVC|nr:hypothetical protein BO88DRAFT_483685 [Aspergillus vadensis CBS 113365]PYH74660.1 hypothetical protein BO88DRAFT_483685 [Aspergillus vadensis CBS 113365]
MEPHNPTTMNQSMAQPMNQTMSSNHQVQTQTQPKNQPQIQPHIQPQAQTQIQPQIQPGPEIHFIPYPPQAQFQDQHPQTEILLHIDANNHPICILSNTSQPTTTTIDPNIIISNPTSYILAFRDPHSLYHAFTNPTTYTLLTRHAHYIRLYLLHDLQIGYLPCSPHPLPFSSQNRDSLFFFDCATDPNMHYITPPRLPCMPSARHPVMLNNDCNNICAISWPGFDKLMGDWRVACRAIPRGHDVWYMVFNLASRGGWVPLGVGRSLQLLSTAVCVKERVKGRFRCVVDGCARGVVERFDGFLAANVASLGWAVVGDEEMGEGEGEVKVKTEEGEGRVEGGVKGDGGGAGVGGGSGGKGGVIVHAVMVDAMVMQWCSGKYEALFYATGVSIEIKGFEKESIGLSAQVDK